MAELWAGFEAANRAYQAGEKGEAIMIIVRRPIAVLNRLKAEHGEDVGGEIWREAMARHSARVRAWGHGTA